MSFMNLFNYTTAIVDCDRLIFKDCIFTGKIPKIKMNQPFQEIIVNMKEGTVYCDNLQIQLNAILNDDFHKLLIFMNENNGSQTDSYYCFYCHKYLFTDCPTTNNDCIGCGCCTAWFCEDCAEEHNIDKYKDDLIKSCTVCKYLDKYDEDFNCTCETG